jgi:L-ascorbate metabolism protein UlaG (beta-lactamase superfamily)
LLFDPYITKNPLAKSVDIKTIPADYILISHGHDDHVGDAVKIAKRNKAMVIANYEVAQWLKDKGTPKIRAKNLGGSCDLDFGRVKSVSAIHSSSMPDGDYGGVPGGFVIESKEGNFYYSRDTALTHDMKLISDTTKLKFAVLCIGDNFTMGMDDAIRAAEYVKRDHVMGVHYDTFPEIEINHSAAQRKFSARGKALHLLHIKETFNFV